MSTTPTAPEPATTRAGGGPHPTCGTFGGYERHRYRRETPCEECRKANAAEKRDQGHTRARDRARAELARRYRAEYEQIAEALRPDRRRWDKARAELARRRSTEFRRLLTDELARIAIEDNA